MAATGRIDNDAPHVSSCDRRRVALAERSVAGGDAHELLRTREQEVRHLRGRRPELWRLPLSGSPRKLDVDARKWSAFHISPDGTKIAFVARAGREGFEVWALENIVPPVTVRK